MSENEYLDRCLQIKKDHPFWSAADIVYKTLLDAIICHRLKPGSKVKQEEIAELLEVSRSPVRESITKLEEEGYIEKIAGQGYCVYTLKMKDYMQMIEFRTALESLGAKLATERETAQDQKDLGAVMNALNQARVDGEYEKMLDLDQEFHKTIIRHSRNQYLISTYWTLLPKIMFFRHFVAKEQFYLSIYQRHKGIYEAILDRNEDLASERIIRHLMVSLEKAL